MIFFIEKMVQQLNILNGDKEWYINGKRHREDGPAIEFYDGEKLWYKNGLIHREDGPATEYTDGYKEWYLNNICYGYNKKFSIDSWKKFAKTVIFS